MNYRSGTINVGNVFSHVTPKKGVCDFPHVVWFLFYKLLKFDIINADVVFCKRGHNLEAEAKLNKARHSFSNEVSLKVVADFQLISSKDTRKRTKNVYPKYAVLFYREKDEKRFLRFSWLGVKIPSTLTDVDMGQFTTTMAYDNLK